MTDRQLDALIAEKVMGWTDFVPKENSPQFDVTATPPKWDCMRYQRVPDYSTSIAAAWEVVEKFPRFEIVGSENRWAVLFDRESDIDYVIDESVTKAICLAALKAKGVEV